MPGRPHPVAVMTRARELNQAGWNSAEIRRVLAKEGHVVSRYAIYRWVHPDFAEQMNEKARERRVERREKRLEREAERMREAGLSEKAIRVVLRLYFAAFDDAGHPDAPALSNKRRKDQT